MSEDFPGTHSQLVNSQLYLEHERTDHNRDYVIVLRSAGESCDFRPGTDIIRRDARDRVPDNRPATRLIIKLFITGICGRLGRAVAVEATAQGMSVEGIDLVPWPDNVSLPQHARVHMASYEDIATITPMLMRCDAMVHTAGAHGAHLEQLDLSTFLEKNVMKVAALLEAAKGAGVRRVNLSSTMEILVGRDWTASGATLLNKSSPPRTDSPYSISKLLMEQLASQFALRHDLAVSCNRYAGFGWVPDEHLGPRLLARTLSPIDAARAAILAAANLELRGETFLIAPAAPHGLADIATALTNPHAVVERCYPGSAAVLERIGTELAPTHFWPICEIRKARDILGWSPRLTFDIWLKTQGWVGENAETRLNEHLP